MLISKDSRGLISLRAADRVPAKLLGQRRFGKVLNLVTRLEGGPMTSSTLRRVLAETRDITVGAHAYGSLLEQGMCDIHTVIGPYCSIGKNVRRYGAAHPVSDASMHPYFFNPALGVVDAEADVERTSITIGADAWIGSNVTILPTCTEIGVGAVVGAGSVVTKNIPDFAIAVGNPAKVLRYRHGPAVQSLILESRYWELPPKQAQSVLRELESAFLDAELSQTP